jgi:hypothetical protein
MLLYFDLDKKELVNAPGTGGAIRSYSFIRGDETPLELHITKAGEEVTDVTNIVFVIKTSPGPDITVLSMADEWENPEETTYFTSLLNLNGEDLDELLGVLKSKSLLCQVCCHHAGQGPITSQLVTANVGGDLYRGDEDTPFIMPTPEEWLEARRPAPLALSEVPANGTSQVESLLISGTVTVDGNYSLTLTSADLTASPVTLTLPVLISESTTDIAINARALLIANTAIAAAFTISRAANELFLLRKAPGNDASLSLALAELTGDGLTAPATSSNTTAGIAGTVATALAQSAIVTHSDSTWTEWACVKLTPMTWLPRTAGILWDADESEWIRLTRTGGTLDYTTLPDQ